MVTRKERNKGTKFLLVGFLIIIFGAILRNGGMILIGFFLIILEIIILKP